MNLIDTLKKVLASIEPFENNANEIHDDWDDSRRRASLSTGVKELTVGDFRKVKESAWLLREALRVEEMKATLEDMEIYEKIAEPIAWEIKAHTNYWRKEMIIFSKHQSIDPKDFPEGYEIGGQYSYTPLYKNLTPIEIKPMVQAIMDLAHKFRTCNSGNDYDAIYYRLQDMCYTLARPKPSNQIVPKMQIQEHPSPNMQLAGAKVKIDMTGVDAEPGTVGWLTASKVWTEMVKSMKVAQ